MERQARPRVANTKRPLAYAEPSSSDISDDDEYIDSDAAAKDGGGRSRTPKALKRRRTDQTDDVTWLETVMVMVKPEPSELCLDKSRASALKFSWALALLPFVSDQLNIFVKEDVLRFSRSMFSGVFDATHERGFMPALKSFFFSGYDRVSIGTLQAIDDILKRALDEDAELWDRVFGVVAVMYADLGHGIKIGQERNDGAVVIAMVDLLKEFSGKPLDFLQMSQAQLATALATASERFEVGIQSVAHVGLLHMFNTIPHLKTVDALMMPEFFASAFADGQCMSLDEYNEARNTPGRVEDVAFLSEIFKDVVDSSSNGRGLSETTLTAVRTRQWTVAISVLRKLWELQHRVLQLALNGVMEKDMAAVRAHQADRDTAEAAEADKDKAVESANSAAKAAADAAKVVEDALRLEAENQSAVVAEQKRIADVLAGRLAAEALAAAAAAAAEALLHTPGAGCVGSSTAGADEADVAATAAAAVQRKEADAETDRANEELLKTLQSSVSSAADARIQAQVVAQRAEIDALVAVEKRKTAERLLATVSAAVVVAPPATPAPVVPPAIPAPDDGLSLTLVLTVGEGSYPDKYGDSLTRLLLDFADPEGRSFVGSGSVIGVHSSSAQLSVFKIFIRDDDSHVLDIVAVPIRLRNTEAGDSGLLPAETIDDSSQVAQAVASELNLMSNPKSNTLTRRLKALKASSSTLQWSRFSNDLFKETYTLLLSNDPAMSARVTSYTGDWEISVNRTPEVCVDNDCDSMAPPRLAPLTVGVSALAALASGYSSRDTASLMSYQPFHGQVHAAKDATSKKFQLVVAIVQSPRVIYADSHVVALAWWAHDTSREARQYPFGSCPLTTRLLMAAVGNAEPGTARPVDSLSGGSTHSASCPAPRSLQFNHFSAFRIKVPPVDVQAPAPTVVVGTFSEQFRCMQISARIVAADRNQLDESAGTFALTFVQGLDTLRTLYYSTPFPGDEPLFAIIYKMPVPTKRDRSGCAATFILAQVVAKWEAFLAPDSQQQTKYLLSISGAMRTAVVNHVIEFFGWLLDMCGTLNNTLSLVQGEAGVVNPIGTLRKEHDKLMTFHEAVSSSSSASGASRVNSPAAGTYTLSETQLDSSNNAVRTLLRSLNSYRLSVERLAKYGVALAMKPSLGLLELTIDLRPSRAPRDVVARLRWMSLFDRIMTVNEFVAEAQADATVRANAGEELALSQTLICYRICRATTAQMLTVDTVQMSGVQELDSNQEAQASPTNAGLIFRLIGIIGSDSQKSVNQPPGRQERGSYVAMEVRSVHGAVFVAKDRTPEGRGAAPRVAGIVFKVTEGDDRWNTALLRRLTGAPLSSLLPWMGKSSLQFKMVEADTQCTSLEVCDGQFPIPWISSPRLLNLLKLSAQKNSDRLQWIRNRSFISSLQCISLYQPTSKAEADLAAATSRPGSVDLVDLTLQ